MRKRRERIGLWLIGVCGGVGASVALGVAALRTRRTATTGLVTALPCFADVEMIKPGDLVVGGHDIRAESLTNAVRGLHHRAGVIPSELITRCAPALRAMQRNVRPGTLIGTSEPVRAMAHPAMGVDDRTAADAVERLANDIRTFQQTHRLDRVVVVNVASCEPPFTSKPSPRKRTATSGKRSTLATARFSETQFARTLTRRGPSPLPSSALYALAAIESGCAYVNFTPSTGIDLPPLRARARERGIPWMGRDGKTGETLVKSALAPMFAMRNLAVRTWVGQNILGNRDGAILKDRSTKSAKLRTKDRAVTGIVPGEPMTTVSIDYAPSLDDWKIAWDFIHFEGFLGAKMSMQFIWQGCDSLLAAPLVIDLALLAELEMRHGRSGPMRHLAFFFKDPADVEHHDLPTQWRLLIDHLSTYTTPRDRTP